MFEESRPSYFSSLEGVFKIRARSWALSAGPAVPRSTGVVRKQGGGPEYTWEKPHLSEIHEQELESCLLHVKNMLWLAHK